MNIIGRDIEDLKYDDLEYDLHGVSNGFLAEFFYMITGQKIVVTGEIEKVYE